MTKEIKDSFYAFLTEDANYTNIEQYPIIEKYMVSNSIPSRIVPFEKYHKEKDLSNCFICFYTADDNFERVRRYPNKYVELFKKCQGIIGFDFSVHTDMPIIKQKSQMNDNISLTYYFARQGVPVIPNIRYGIEDTKNDYLSAFPKHTLIAVGTHGFIKTKTQQYTWYCYLENIINSIEPTGIIVYGTLNNKLFGSIKDKTPVYCYDAWIDQRVKELKQNGNKRR